MRATKRGYLMSMIAGSAIIAACTIGAVSAQPAAPADQAASRGALAGGADPGAPTGTDAPPASAVSASPSPAPVTGAGQAAGNGAGTAAATGPVSPIGSVDGNSPTAATAPTPAENESETEAEGRATPSSPPARPTSAPPAPPTPAPPARPTPAQPAPPSSSPPTRPAATAPAPVASKYKDGTYSATGSYNSPGGTEKLGVTLTLTGDKITGSKLDLQGSGGISKSYQGLFQSGYASQVVGRPVDSVHLGAVAGSSLTALGFNQALAQIQAQARG